MTSLAENFNFLRGLAVALIGLVIWFLANAAQRLVILAGLDESVALVVLIYLGAAFVVGGPIWYWLLWPVLVGRGSLQIQDKF